MTFQGIIQKIKYHINIKSNQSSDHSSISCTNAVLNNKLINRKS